MPGLPKQIRRWLHRLAIAPERLSPVEFIVLFTAAFMSLYNLAGPSPIVLFDTSYEQSFVNWCLERSLCPLFGAPTNLRGFWQGGCWTYLRTAWQWMGLGLDAVHLILQATDAISIALLAVVVSRQWGKTAAWISSVACLLVYLKDPVIMAGVHNSRFILAPSALATCLAVEGTATGRRIPLLMAALVASALVNVHAAALPFVAGLVLSAAVVSPRPCRAIVGWGALLCGLIVAWSPGVWMGTVKLFSGAAAVGQEKTVVLGTVWIWATAACGVLTILHSTSPRGEKSQWHTPVLLLLPVVAAYPLGQLLFGVRGDQKYLVHILPAAAMASAAAAVEVATRLRSLVSRPGERRGVPSPVVWLGRTYLPLAIGLLVIICCARPRLQREEPTHDGMRALMHHLQSRGWSRQRMLTHLKSPHAHALISAILAASPLDTIRREAIVPSRNFYALFLPEDCATGLVEVGAVRLHAYRGRVLVGVESDTLLDWNSFRACIVGRDVPRRCSVVEPRLHSPLPFQPMPLSGTMPDASAVDEKVVELELTMNAPRDGRTWLVAMPGPPLVCAGRIVSGPYFVRVGDAGSEARAFPARGTAGTGRLVLRFCPGTTSCPLYRWSDVLPFFVEAPEPLASSIVEALECMKEHD